MLPCLVVGGDGLVGTRLFALMQKLGADVMATTRRREDTGVANRVFFDLADPMTELPSSAYSVAFLCAAITGIAVCEDDPVRTYQINVLNTVALAKRLIADGTRIVFLSSNTVFDGVAAWPDEETPYSPTCEYGRQKVSVERQLLSLSTPSVPVMIVRLSKVLAPGTGMVLDFVRHLMAGEPCTAFTDLRMCPVSPDYTTGSLLTIARAGISGIFHLSGEIELSYADFASRLAIRLGADPSLVQPGLSTASGARVVFRPTHPGLGMQRTRLLLGIGAEPFSNLMKQLFQN
jgi:dTDP-4-dehydrorhamnose reductase